MSMTTTLFTTVNMVGAAPARHAAQVARSAPSRPRINAHRNHRRGTAGSYPIASPPANTSPSTVGNAQPGSARYANGSTTTKPSIASTSPLLKTPMAGRDSRSRWK